MHTPNEHAGRRIEEYDPFERVPLSSVREVLGKQKYLGIEVDEREELELSPENGAVFECFSRVRVEKYRDLQLLGLLPRNLDEAKVRRAIAEDDDEAYALARSAACSSYTTTPCKCHTDVKPVLDHNAKQASYEMIRSYANRTLAAALSDHYGALIAPHDPAPELVRKWKLGLERGLYGSGIFVAALEDIKVKAQAKLLVNRKLKTLLARNILIHQTGSIVCPGSYIKIEAASIQSFLMDPSAVLKIYTDVKWRLS